MEMVLYSRLCPLCFPSARGKRACHPDPRGPWREGFSWADLDHRSSGLLPPPSSEPESQPRDGGWRSVSTLICFFL